LWTTKYESLSISIPFPLHKAGTQPFCSEETPRQQGIYHASARVHVSTWTPAPDGDKPPKPIADLLASFTRRVGMPEPSALGVIFAKWSDLVGTALGENVNPVSLHHGVLTVIVVDPAWATQMRFLSANLLSTINDGVGAGTVTEIVVQVRRSGRRSSWMANKPRE
jgi:predicted nucleic acid-binding Zn ribbon protein